MTRSLFDSLGPVYPTGAGVRRVETSIKAGARVNLDLNERQQRVYEAIERSGDRGLTADELCELLGRVRNSIAPRCTELQKLGLVFVVGTRPNPTGSRANVYVTVRR